MGTGTPKVSYFYANGSANHARVTKVTYPNGRIVRYEYDSGHDDKLSRVSFLAADSSGSVGTHWARYSYLGLGSIVKADYEGPKVRYDLASGSGNDPQDSASGGGLDRFDRVVDLRWIKYADEENLVDMERIKHGYDKASNRLWRENMIAKAQSPVQYYDEK